MKQYEIVTADGYRTGFVVKVEKSSDLLNAARPYLGADRWTIRHHETYSDLYYDGRIIYSLEWVE